MARWRALAAILLVAVALAACDGRQPRPAPSPSPSAGATASATPVTGLSVAVVLPPPEVATEAERASLADAIDRLGRTHRDAIGTLRVVEPDGLPFVADTVALLAREGADLVCALGTGAIDRVVDVASDYPSTRFCAAPAAARRVPGNVLQIDVRVEEMGYLAGVAAGIAGEGNPAGIVAGDRQHALDRQRRGFERGLASVRPDAPTPLVSFSALDADRAHSLAMAQYDAGASVIYALAGAGDTGVLDAAEEARTARAAAATEAPTAAPTTAGPTPAPSPAGRPAPALVIGRRDALTPTSSDTTDDEASEPTTSSPVLLAFHERLDVALDVAIRRALSTWSVEPASVGLADGAFEVVGGSAPQAEAVRPQIDRVVGDIRAGKVQVLPPS